MGQPYVGEIRMFGGNFAPAGWQFCNGALLPISENEVLFQLIGTTYGGDGQETFAVPDLQGRVAVHMGQGGGLSNYVIGQQGGTETVTLTTQQIPSHNHLVMASAVAGTVSTPTNAVLANGSATNTNVYLNPGNWTAPIALNAGTVAGAGGSQPHENMGPYLVVNFIISLFGVFPTQT
jgi:microcystin-dependent protein